MASVGKTDLSEMLASLDPVINDGVYVYCLLPHDLQINLSDVVGTFSEKEGRTLILSQERADQLGLTYHFRCKWITLNVHSALEAVGLTAAFSTALEEAGISCNVIAGYYHDHIFVPVELGERAVEVLVELKGINIKTSST